MMEFGSLDFSAIISQLSVAIVFILAWREERKERQAQAQSHREERVQWVKEYTELVRVAYGVPMNQPEPRRTQTMKVYNQKSEE